MRESFGNQSTFWTLRRARQTQNHSLSRSLVTLSTRPKPWIRNSKSQVLPSEDEFPYTIRLESLITESCGSSSMASVCGGSLALFNAVRKSKRPTPILPAARPLPWTFRPESEGEFRRPGGGAALKRVSARARPLPRRAPARSLAQHLFNLEIILDTRRGRSRGYSGRITAREC